MLRYIKTGMMLLSIAYIVIGMMLLVMPQTSLLWICYAFGAVVLITGIVCLVQYARIRGTGFTAPFMLVGGVITACIGVTMLCGILLIVEGALNLGCVLYAAMELRTLDRMANAAASAAMSAIGDALDEAEAAESGIPMDGPVVYNAESKDVSEDGE